MQYIKDFFTSKTGKRALWMLLDSTLALFIALLTYLASNNVGWAIAVIPFATALFQMLTKFMNTPKPTL